MPAIPIKTRTVLFEPCRRGDHPDCRYLLPYLRCSCTCHEPEDES